MCHDLGSLVHAVLAIRRNQAVIRTTEPAHPARDPHRHRRPADHSVQTGMEAGIKIAVLRLCGAEAVGAFSAHIEAIERDRDGTPGETRL